MRTINNRNELLQNIKLLDEYLDQKTTQACEFALDLIKRGTCFVAVKESKNYYFYPSRFIGYFNNNMKDHLNNAHKDGRVTNSVISKILGNSPEFDDSLERHYRIFCNSLGFTANEKGSFGVERKYWKVIE